jgi:protein-tyrosine phosphatase
MNDPWPRGRSHDGGVDQIPLPPMWLAEAPGERGSLFVCGKHAVAPDSEGLIEELGGNVTVVCLNPRHELEPQYPNYVQWLRTNAGGRAVWEPIADFYMPPAEEMVPFVDSLVGRIEVGTSLVVHCGAGIGRAGTTAILILIRMGLSAEDAERIVAVHRPMAGPQAGPQQEAVDGMGKIGPIKRFGLAGSSD